MQLKSLGITLLVISTILIAGCRTAPVHNVSDESITPWQTRDLSQDDVSKAIISAGQSLTWIMQEKEEGHIQGTLLLREHVAVVDIYYDKTKFSIKYKSSKNLNYDGTDIHRNYNNWIINLTNRISLHISQL